MTSRRTPWEGPSGRSLRATLVAAGLAVCASVSAHAIGLEFLDREVTGSFDTTISTGVLLRAAPRDANQIGIINGGTAPSNNVDDGDLNYSLWDPVSAQTRATHELQLRWRNLAMFGRVWYFYDPVIKSTSTDRTPLGGVPKRRAGLRIQPLDAYFTAEFDLGGMPLKLRFGNQVISWGESTFIQNGVNVINPVDVTALRVPGAELRNALLPIPAVDVSLGISERLSIEAFYQFFWQQTYVEPLGTFFSTTDVGSEGAQFAFLGFGRTPDYPVPPPGTLNPPLGTAVPYKGDIDARDGEEGGVALRWFEPALWSTEFGFYYVHYHSRTPLISAFAGTAQGLANGDYGRSARYVREFPEDIDLFAASFSNEIGRTGIAVQGELSYRLGQPLQVDDVEILFAGFTPIPGVGTIVAPNQLGVFRYGDYIRGWRRKDVLQPQVTFTKLIGPTLGADQVLLLGEVGATLVMGMEDKSDFRYEGPATYTGGNPAFTRAGVQPFTTRDGFADARSWGYRLVVRPTFNRAIGAINLEPVVAFQHDVQGTTPSPIVNFVENRKAVTLAVKGIYLEKMTAEVGFTTFFDGGRHNLLKDRDFISIAFSYSF